MFDYVVMEGVDTSGKTTQWNLLKKSLNGIDLLDFLESNKEEIKEENILFTKEPSGTKLGNIIKDITLHNNITTSLEVKFYLFLSQRIELLELIRTSFNIKATKNIIISDRSFISGVAYSYMDIKKALDIYFLATNNLLPKKIIFLMISKDIIKERLIQKDKKDIIENKGAKFIYEIQNRYFDILDYLIYYARKHKLKVPKILYLNGNKNKEFLFEKIYDFLFYTDSK